VPDSPSHKQHNILWIEILEFFLFNTYEQIPLNISYCVTIHPLLTNYVSLSSLNDNTTWGYGQGQRTIGTYTVETDICTDRSCQISNEGNISRWGIRTSTSHAWCIEVVTRLMRWETWTVTPHAPPKLRTSLNALPLTRGQGSVV
jgi:hypothetical protein